MALYETDIYSYENLPECSIESSSRFNYSGSADSEEPACSAARFHPQALPQHCLYTLPQDAFDLDDPLLGLPLDVLVL